MAMNFVQVITDTKPQIQEGWKAKSKIKTPPPKKKSPRHIIIKLQRNKGKKKTLKKQEDGGKNKILFLQE